MTRMRNALTAMGRDRLRTTSRNQRAYGSPTTMANPPVPPMTLGYMRELGDHDGYVI